MLPSWKPNQLPALLLGVATLLLSTTRPIQSQAAAAPAAAATPVIAPEHLAAPWMAPREIKFPYEGLHNSLRQLLDVQAQQQRVSVTFFTQALQAMMLNNVYSLAMYGKASNYVVFVLDPRSLERCLALRLPCHNATHLMHDVAGDHGFHQQEHMFSSPMWQRLMHLKPSVLAEVFRMNVSVHFSDADVSYLRPVWASYERLMDTVGADICFMNEFNTMNAGNLVVRHNLRTAKLVERWASPAPPGKFLSDQDYLVSLRGQAFEFCDTAAECQAVKDSGFAAALRHPPQFGKVSWTGHCPGRRPWPACAPYTLYLHLICFSGPIKVRHFKYYDLWHIERDGFTPRPLPHPFLPCKDGGLAWAEGAVPDPAAKVYAKFVYDDADDEDVKRKPP